jgi:hypothetical protein
MFRREKRNGIGSGVFIGPKVRRRSRPPNKDSRPLYTFCGQGIDNGTGLGEYVKSMGFSQ